MFDNQAEFDHSVTLTVVNIVTLPLTFIVHRAVYKLLAKLPDRSINQIIYPYMVSIQIHNLFLGNFETCRLIEISRLRTT